MILCLVSELTQKQNQKERGKKLYPETVWNPLPILYPRSGKAAILVVQNGFIFESSAITLHVPTK